MKTIIATVIAASAFAIVLAEDTAKVEAEGQEATAKKTAFEQRSGGLVRRPAEGPNIVVVDGREKPGKVLKYFEQENIQAQGSAPGLPLKTYAEPLQATTPIEGALAIRQKEEAAMAIVIVNGGATMPGLTLCPEERVAAINADRYENKEFLLLKELWRAVGFIGGVGYSKYSADPMQPVFSREELEAMQGTALLPMSLNMLRTFNTCFGIKPAQNLPYIAAVRQGWAPAPTNEVQQAIWDRIKAEQAQIPTNPLRITPGMKPQGK